jgi:putative ABC transport system permease protein
VNIRTALAPFAIARRRLRSDPLFAAALFAATAATAFLFALVPQVFGRMAESSLEETVAGANALERNVSIAGAGAIDAAQGEDPVASVVVQGDEHERRFPARVQEVTGDGRASVETSRYTILTRPGEAAIPGTTRYLTLRFLEDADEHVEMVEGDAPTDAAGPVEPPFGDRTAVTGLEIALSQTTADQLSVELGDRLFIGPAADDPLVRNIPLTDRRLLAVDVVGILGAREGDDAWLRESRLGRAAIRDTETMRFIFGYGLVAGEEYNELLAGVDPLPLRYEWRFLVDPEAVAAQDTGELASEVRQLEAAFGQTTFGQRLGLGVRTGLGRILARHEDDRQAAQAVLAVGGIALLAVALSVLGVLAALAADRRSEAIALLRSRGGSLAQTLSVQAVEGLLVAVPAGALGYAAATLAAGRSPELLPGLLVAGIVLAVGVLLAGAAVGTARRAVVPGRPDEALVPRLSPVRIALESLVVIAALAGAYLLRRRGLSSEGGFDPYLAAVPVLVGLAAAIVALRLYPLPLRALAWAAAPRRDLVPALGLRRLSRSPTLAVAPLLVVLLATSVGVLAATLAGTISVAQDRVAASDLTPLDTGTLDVFRVGIVVAGAYATVALALAPVLSARPRQRDLGYLRALGLSRRDALGLAAYELVPPVALALVLGVVLGLTLGYLVEPGLDLAALAAGEQAALRPAVAAPILLVAGLVLVTAAVTVLTGAAAARVNLSRVLRMGER